MMEWPVRGSVVLRFKEPHRGVPSNGIAVQASPGARVLAALEGKAVFIDQNLAGYGTSLILEHSGGLATVYSGMSEVLLAPGQTVRRGEVIGKFQAGSEGRGTRLYFEVRRDAKAEDPLNFLPSADQKDRDGWIL